MIKNRYALRLLVIGLAALASRRGEAQGPVDSTACRSVLGAPVKDSLSVTVGLTMKAFDSSVTLTPRYRADIATGVREMLRLPTPLPLLVYNQLLPGEGGNKGNTATVIPTISGAYAATVSRDGRFSHLRVVGGARAGAFDSAILAALQALSDSSLAPSLPDTLHGDSVEVRMNVAPLDTAEKSRDRPARPILRGEPLFLMKVPALGPGKTVAPMPGNRAPRYPIVVRDQHVEGKVLLQFVVGADGHGIPESVQIREATATEFVEAVLAAFPALRFYPLDVRGCHLASLVQMPFEFSLRY